MASARDNFPEFKRPGLDSPGFQQHQVEALASMMWTCLFLSHASTSLSHSYGRGWEAWWTAPLVVLPCIMAGLPGAAEGREGSVRAVSIYAIYGLAPAIVALAGNGSLLSRTISTALILIPLWFSLLPSGLSATGSVSAWGSLTAGLVSVNTFTILTPLPRPMGFSFRGHFSDINIALGYALLAVIVGLSVAFITTFARYEVPRRVNPAKELAACAGLFLHALCEEVLYRGMLLNVVMEWFPNQNLLALIVASCFFGVAHLTKEKHGFRKPNWRYALTSASYGAVCGLAWQQSKRIPVSAVVHVAFNYAIRALLRKESIE